jgi:hypothetical protein
MDDPKLIPCPECGGTGKVQLRLDNLPGPAPPLEIDCPTCGGSALVRFSRLLDRPRPQPLRRAGLEASPAQWRGTRGLVLHLRIEF